MALLTMIARVIDGLPLVGTMQDDEQVATINFKTVPLPQLRHFHFQSGRSILDYQNQAKMLFRKLGTHSPARSSIETGPYLFHYLIENDVCYLVMVDKMYSKRLAFNYLEDLAQEFHANYGRRVNSVTRPYAFIEFDVYIQKAKKQLTDRRRNISSINTQLQDVQRIMVQNIDDVLQRGTVLAELDTKTQNLSMMSQKYKKDAKLLNRKSMYVKAAAVGIIFLVFFMYFWVL
ncbi:vesicle-trafficking protein SEC22b isoform X1 [Drosophila biarmipes]|uniref:vesicle-trafficking protein SEC22b isoform X1 n=1 Tax=Drosophila biarmipes TaxID=125945 RepID=UPI001CDAD69C|nr:vesicle-trafficking protein SEC22b isoform X1 [Drosophila biarmipes]